MNTPSRIQDYATVYFDCDGVILDSNTIKTDAFYQCALPWGEVAARKLRDHHVAHGGISRYRKFEWFLENVVGQDPADPGDYERLLGEYAKQVRAGLRDCPADPALQPLREQLPGQRWVVVSGSDQDELREVLSARGLAPLFDGGIFGSPATKPEILEADRAAQPDRTPALFIGDARADAEAAAGSGIDFCFVEHWSELSETPAPHAYSVRDLGVLLTTAS